MQSFLVHFFLLFALGSSFEEPVKACKAIWDGGSRPEVLQIVTLATNKDRDSLRFFVSRLNHLEQQNKSVFLRLTVYSIGADPVFLNEMTLWKGVAVVDVASLISMQGQGDWNATRPDVDNWRAFCIKHAVDFHGRALYIANDLLLNDDVDAVKLIETFNLRGSIFFSKFHRNVADFSTKLYDSLCDHRVQGYTLGGFAYHNILVPLVECAARRCSAADRKLLLADNREKLLQAGAVAKAVECAADGSVLFEENSKIDREQVCYLQSSDHILFNGPRADLVELEDGLLDSSPRQGFPLKIALGFPAISDGNASEGWVERTPLAEIFLPSLLSTIKCPNAGEFEYSLYMGIDEGDAVYDSPENQRQLRAFVERATSRCPMQLHIFKFFKSGGWVTYLWNGLYEAALHHGADYFYQVNDDIRFITPGWTEAFVGALQNSSVPNVGVAGPTDINNESILTQAFVSRMHHALFGYFFPPSIQNWFCDDWITILYTGVKLLFREIGEYEVQNTNAHGTRYSPCSTTFFISALQRDTPLLESFVRERNGTVGEEKEYMQEEEEEEEYVGEVAHYDEL